MSLPAADNEDLVAHELANHLAAGAPGGWSRVHLIAEIDEARTMVSARCTHSAGTSTLAIDAITTELVLRIREAMFVRQQQGRWRRLDMEVRPGPFAAQSTSRFVY